MAKTKQQVEEFIAPIVEGLGLEVVEVEFAKKHDGMNLTIFIDKKGGVTIEDCEKVHRAIDEPLDELDPTNGASYTLNVSSPGLDREIKTDKDFNRNIGETLDVNLFKKIGACKKFVGELVSFTENAIIILDKKGKEVEIERALISKATKHIEF